jgi:hypothetical protein
MNDMERLFLIVRLLDKAEEVSSVSHDGDDKIFVDLRLPGSSTYEYITLTVGKPDD